MVSLRASGWVHNPSQKNQICPQKIIIIIIIINQRTSAPERADNFFSLYPDPVGMRTDHKPRSDVLEHLQMRDLLHKPKAHGSSSFSSSALVFSPVQPAVIHPSEEKWRCPLWTGRQMEINTNINPPALWL